MSGMEKIAYWVTTSFALLDFVVFSVVSAHFGGGVSSIPIFHRIAEEGPYFLDNHGSLTEVSRQVFVTLIWQSRFLILIWPTVGIWGYFRSRKRSAG
jgi:hypothetical protein